MKIGVFTDAHYCHSEILCYTRRPSLSLKKIREAMEDFCKNGVELCICLGDLTDHGAEDTKESVAGCFFEALELIRSYGIPFILVPGNHDYLMLNASELEAAGVQIPPYTVSFGGFRFIALDGNYRSDGRRFDEAGVLWNDSNLPESQCEFLKEALEESTEPAIVLIHENLDPTVEGQHIVKNAEEIRRIISDKAKMVLQGHYHKGSEWEHCNVPYITIPAMCEGEGNSYRIIEL